MRADVENISFHELEPEISWVKGGPGQLGGGSGLGQSGCRRSPGGECFTPNIHNFLVSDKDLGQRHLGPKGVPGPHRGGWGLGQSGVHGRPGGECVAPHHRNVPWFILTNIDVSSFTGAPSKM